MLMRIFPIMLALVVGVWAALAIAAYNAPLTSPEADLELHCRYGLCEDRDMAALARYRSFGVDTAQDPVTIRRLLLQSPASPETWCDFADALNEHDRKEEAAQAFDHAVSLAPNSPPILIRAGTALLLAGNQTAALLLFQRILAKTPEYPPDAIFSLCGRFGVTSAEILGALLPANQTAPAAYLRFLLHAEAAADAADAWVWIQSHSLATPPLSSDYATFLVEHKNYAQALATWSAGRREQPSTNLIFDPGFELPPVDPPFGWRIEVPGKANFEIIRDPAEHHSGSASLRIHFNGQENISFRHVSQSIVAAPGAYQFSAWVKTDSLTTNQGLRLAIEDADHPGAPLWVQDPPVTGTQRWTEISTVFTVPPQTGLIRVIVLRSPSTKIENKISGTAWLDDVGVSPTHR